MYGQRQPKLCTNLLNPSKTKLIPSFRRISILCLDILHAQYAKITTSTRHYTQRKLQSTLARPGSQLMRPILVLYPLDSLRHQHRKVHLHLPRALMLRAKPTPSRHQRITTARAAVDIPYTRLFEVMAFEIPAERRVCLRHGDDDEGGADDDDGCE